MNDNDTTSGGRERVWYICGWRGLYEPDDARRKGSKSPLKFVKEWVAGDTNMSRQQVEATRRAIVRTGGRGLWALWSWIKIVAADHARFRGYLLDAARRRPADFQEIAEMIGTWAVTAGEVEAALARLETIGLVRQVELWEVYQLKAVKNDDGKVEYVREFMVPSENGGIIPQDSDGVSHNRNPNPNPNGAPTGVGASNWVHKHKHKQETGDDPAAEPPPGNQTATATENPDGSVDIELEGEGERNDIQPSEPAGTEGPGDPGPPSCPDGYQSGPYGDPAVFEGLAPAYQRPWVFGGLIYNALGFPNGPNRREMNSQISAMASRWDECLKYFHAARWSAGRVTEFAEARLRATDRIREDKTITPEEGDYIKWGHMPGMPEAVARAKVWMKNTLTACAKWLQRPV